MNAISSKKLLDSKWTAVRPQHKEKHFLITDVEFDKCGTVIYCEIEAIMTKRRAAMHWQDLKNPDLWLCGWL